MLHLFEEVPFQKPSHAWMHADLLEDSVAKDGFTDVAQCLFCRGSEGRQDVV